MWQKFCPSPDANTKIQIQIQKYPSLQTIQLSLYYLVDCAVCNLLSLRNIYFQTKICFELRKGGVHACASPMNRKKVYKQTKKNWQKFSTRKLWSKIFKEDRTLVSLYAGQTGQHSSQLIWFVTIIKITIHHYKSVESYTI